MVSEEEFEELQERVEQLEDIVLSDSSPDYSENKKESVAEFMARHEASTHNDKVLVMGYYLEHIEGEENFTSGELEDYYRKTKLKAPKTIAVPLNHNAKKGLIMEDGEDGQTKEWILTRSGEQKVENELRGDNE
ncbi:MAG: hypothetical protein ABEJ83_00140 [Candidatus Nanohaloarchaea archaeon]